MNEFEELILDICEELNIAIPKISYDKSKFYTETMRAMVDVELNTIYINKDLFDFDVYFAIAHELRHIWQIKTDKDKYFSSYIPRDKTDVETYNMQIAELDANAYALTIMQDFYGVTPIFKGMSEKIVSEIYKMADKLDV